MKILILSVQSGMTSTTRYKLVYPPVHAGIWDSTEHKVKCTEFYLVRYDIDYFGIYEVKGKILEVQNINYSFYLMRETIIYSLF